MIFNSLELFWEQIIKNLHQVTTDRLTNVSNYSGIHRPENDYRKFDIVYSTGDGRFYYAREDISDGGGAVINQANRLTLIPDGPATSQGQSHYILDTANVPDALGAEIKEGHLISIANTTGQNDGKYRVLNVQKDQTALNGNPSLTGASIQVIGIGDYQFNNFEPAGPNPVSISALTLDVDGGEDIWAKDLFFFDADYDSSVKFQCNNYKYEFGDGYYINQPKNINSVSMEVDLRFKNRTNREANAIIHFLENHQGQHERDAPSPNLQYSQGISGFRWDGGSTFHPYDSTEMQSKDFYCSEFSHSLNFENSNDISLRLRNLNTSLLRKSDGLFVKHPGDYSDSQFYEKNDVVFFPDNHQYYYWYSDTSSSNVPPVVYVEDPLDGAPEYQHNGQQYWTKDFFWKPSLGLEVSQKPRMKEIALGAGYTQIYQDGINESLLELDLTFNNRSDDEAYAILHFLEQHYGCIPFPFSPPAPYDKKKNFVCETWTHSYKYKDNHTITAKFSESAFGFTPEMMEQISRKAMSTEGEIIIDSGFVMISKDDLDGGLSAGQLYRARIPLENVGDSEVTINSITIENFGTASFYILGQSGNDSSVVVSRELTASDYTIQLPDTQELDSTFRNKTIKLRKNFEPGIKGGYTFTIVGEESLGSFIQYNTGQIQSTLNNEIFTTSYFVNTPLIENKKTNVLQGGAEGFIEVVFDGLSYQTKEYHLAGSGEGFNYDGTSTTVDAINADSGGKIILGKGQSYEKAKISINSNGRFPTVDSNISIYID